MNFLFTSFFYVHKLSAWLFLGAAMRFFGFRLFLVFGFYFEFVQGRAPLKGVVYGRHTRKIPLSQGFSSFKTVHRTVLKFTFFGAPSGLGGFRRLRTATIGASRPPRPPRQSRKLSFADFHAPCNRIFLTSDSHLFGSETNREVVEDNF